MSRYQRAVEIEDLIVTLAKSRRGLTIVDISERYEVSRRTAERMRDAVAERFPLIEKNSDGNDRQKRWRLDVRPLQHLWFIDSSDVKALDEAAQLLRKHGRPNLADRVGRIASRIRFPE